MHPGFPDFSFRPEGWTAARAGAAIRLIPPGAYPDRTRASMVVSPLVPVHSALPDTETLMKQALAAESMQTGVVVQPDDTVERVNASSGLNGLRWTLRVCFPGSDRVQCRAYTMYRDDQWLYGVHLVSDESSYPHFLKTYTPFAESIQPMSTPGPGQD